MQSTNSHFYNPHHDKITTWRRLPHWHQEGKFQFITFHLADSLPRQVRDEMEMEKKIWLQMHPQPVTPEQQKEYDSRFAKRIDVWLDNGNGRCILANMNIAKIVEDTLLRRDNVDYVLHDYVIMPNHVHVLAESLSTNINKAAGAWKSVSAHNINKVLNERGSVWHRESYDRIIRDCIHYDSVRKYIVKNICSGGVIWKGMER